MLKNKSKLKMGIILSLLASSSGYAEDFAKSAPNEITHLENNGLRHAGLSFMQDDIADGKAIDKIILTETQKHEARVWELTEEEEKRYLLLMQNRSATYYQGLRLTPVDILGLNARDDEERQHFASIAVRLEAQKMAQNIAWNNAFHKAAIQKTKGIPVIGEFNKAPYSPYAYQPVPLKNNDVLHLFLTTKEAITTTMLELEKAIEANPTTTLNIYFIHTEPSAIQIWANEQGIKRDLVLNKRITLNQGETQLEALNLKLSDLPLLLLTREGKSSRVDLGRF